jgi:hypothetical protein
VSARAVDVIRPAPIIIAQLPFLCILSGKRQLRLVGTDPHIPIWIYVLFADHPGITAGSDKIALTVKSAA